MKAEHRHQLHTNALADYVGRFVENLRNAPSSRRTTAAWILGGLLVIAVGGWVWAHRIGSWSSDWVRLDGETDPTTLQAIATDASGTIPGRTARFQEARVLLGDGLRKIYTADRLGAARSLERARELYLQLAPECAKDSSILHQEALFGAAQAEEALAGVPREDNAKETRGTLARAQELYRQAADAGPETFLGQKAGRRAGELDTNGAGVARFYAELNKLAEKKK